MSQSFSMQLQTLGNDFFINLSGQFDGSSAWQLANAILTRFHGQGKLFIDTRDLSTVLPFGADMIVNLVPKCMVRKNDVLVRDHEGTHIGLEYFQILSQKYLSGESCRTCFSAASIC